MCCNKRWNAHCHENENTHKKSCARETFAETTDDASTDRTTRSGHEHLSTTPFSFRASSLLVAAAATALPCSTLRIRFGERERTRRAHIVRSRTEREQRTRAANNYKACSLLLSLLAVSALEQSTLAQKKKKNESSRTHMQ